MFYLLTDDVIKRRVVGAGEEVGEEVDHDQALLLGLHREAGGRGGGEGSGELIITDT